MRKSNGVDLSKKLEDEELIEARKLISSFAQPFNSNVVVNNGGIISNSPIHQNVNVSKVRRNTGGVKQKQRLLGLKRRNQRWEKYFLLHQLWQNSSF